MVARVLRAALFVATTLVVLALARPALAGQAAPFCDDRGATGLAAPPALEAPDDAVRRVRACAHGAPGIDALLPHVGSSHHAADAADGDGGQAFVTRAPTKVPPPCNCLQRRHEASARPPSASRSRVERPPRG